jgi:GNAT superfamily N-acetyltransferase
LITFQIETWAQFYPDAKQIMPAHWRELAMDQDKIQLALDEPKYADMDRNGILHILAVRDDGHLVGYYLAFIFPHFHYSQAGLMAFTDIYYVKPEYRVGPIGARLFIEAEKTLKARGVTKAYNSCKIHQNHSRLFEHLGWVPTDICFTKWLGD